MNKGLFIHIIVTLVLIADWVALGIVFEIPLSDPKYLQILYVTGIAINILVGLAMLSKCNTFYKQKIKL